MLYPLISARYHGWLDDLIVLGYLMGSYFLGVVGPPLIIAMAGGGFHLILTRLTRFPSGMLKLLPLRAHGFIELLEGIGIVVITLIAVPPDAPGHPRTLFLLIGFALIGGFALTDYRLLPPADKIPPP